MQWCGDCLEALGKPETLLGVSVLTYPPRCGDWASWPCQSHCVSWALPRWSVCSCQPHSCLEVGMGGQGRSRRLLPGSLKGGK